MAGPFHVKLSACEEAASGAWNKLGFANAHLARLVSDAVRNRAFPLILESNCYAAIGVWAGLQMSAGKASQRLAMVWIDAHGDCNTPETTLSGMLSGMPVAIAIGLCLDRFRKQSGLYAPMRLGQEIERIIAESPCQPLHRITANRIRHKLPSAQPRHP